MNNDVIEFVLMSPIEVTSLTLMNISANITSNTCVTVEVRGRPLPSMTENMPIYITAKQNMIMYVLYIFSACPEGFVQFEEQCLYFRDSPENEQFLGTIYIDAEAFCSRISHAGKQASVAAPWSMQSNHFLSLLIQGFVSFQSNVSYT